MRGEIAVCVGSRFGESFLKIREPRNWKFYLFIYFFFGSFILTTTKCYLEFQDKANFVD